MEEFPQSNDSYAAGAGVYPPSGNTQATSGATSTAHAGGPTSTSHTTNDPFRQGRGSVPADSHNFAKHKRRHRAAMGRIALMVIWIISIVIIATALGLISLTYSRTYQMKRISMDLGYGSRSPRRVFRSQDPFSTHFPHSTRNGASMHPFGKRKHRRSKMHPSPMNPLYGRSLLHHSPNSHRPAWFPGSNSRGAFNQPRPRHSPNQYSNHWKPSHRSVDAGFAPQMAHYY